MRYILLFLLALAFVPAVASAGDRSRGGFSISVGGGYSDRWRGGGGDRSWGNVNVRFGSGWDRGRYNSDWCPPRYYSPRPVYVPVPAYCPPPVVYYRPAPVYCPPPVYYAPRVYYSPPVYYRPAPCPPSYRGGYTSTYGYGVYGR